ncbi:MAG TPA: aminotransferase class I/II-fold pyridoxal phosphate-dependent enzyme, partial [Gemmatimonadales bacterium]|nr:aminotransferase class I/II-fold pyridoxal phosphate-dependent enzyme [Gemmatimonadales bacterium]
MPVVPASRVNALSSEGAFDVLVAARRLEAAGRHVVHLQIGEPDGPTPPHVVEAGVRALHDGHTRYVNPAGLPALRDAIAASLPWRGVRGASAENVVVVPGAKPMVFYALLAVLEAGDEVLVPDPGFPIYPSVVRFGGAVPVRYPLDQVGGLDAERIAPLIGPRTRALVVNLPGNPTGGVATTDALHAIAALAVRHDLVVVSDEVYGRIRYDGRSDSIAALPGMLERTIIVDSFSKSYNMTGWRLGFGVLPAALVERVTTLVVNGTSCTPPFVQLAGLAALTGPQDSVTAAVARFERRRDWLVDGLNGLPGVRCARPEGAFYAFPDVRLVEERSGLATRELAARLLDDYGVAVLP